MKCPKCGSSKLKKLEAKLYRCGPCNMLTDGVDDGTVGRGRPDNNAARNEEFKLREDARRRRPKYR